MAIYTRTELYLVYCLMLFAFVMFTEFKNACVYGVNARLLLNAFDRKTRENSISDPFENPRFATQNFPHATAFRRRTLKGTFSAGCITPRPYFCVSSRGVLLGCKTSISNAALIAAKL